MHPCKPIGKRDPRRYPWICLVRARRQELRLALRDVAQGCSLSIAGLSEIERGREPELWTARRLADFFGLSVEELWPSRRT